MSLAGSVAPTTCVADGPYASFPGAGVAWAARHGDGPISEQTPTQRRRQRPLNGQPPLAALPCAALASGSGSARASSGGEAELEWRSHRRLCHLQVEPRRS